jgi:DNA-binding CsgD family transcriptional regulator
LRSVAGWPHVRACAARCVPLAAEIPNPREKRVRIEVVPGRVSSPKFVGRIDERRRLTTAFEAATARNPAVVLIGGEAGVGKTRLVNVAAADVVARGGRVVIGACLELVDRALPYGPVVQALRQALRTMPPAEFDAAVGPARAELAHLLPELQPAGAAAPDPHPAGLLEHLLGVVERLGADVPLLFVIEDLHWADRSTRDLLVFLARNLQDTQVVLVGTYRSDDLHRRHPLRAVLGELERGGAVTRFELERFTRTEVRDQLSAILESVPTNQLLDAVFERSEGNPFFAEEIVAATRDDDCGTLPSTLRDLLLARVDELPATAREILRTAAVIGRRFPHTLLAAVCDRPEAELLDDLRAAVEQQVLVIDADRYSFRHALVREAVYDDLLPGERTRLHARFAELLVEAPGLFDGGEAERVSEVACHWFQAHDNDRALPAAVDAARAAEQMYAFPEALAHCERALELWDRVADAAERSGMTRVELSRWAAHLADLSGDAERALALARDALREVDPESDPVTAGLIHERVARYLWQIGSGPEGLIENEMPVALVPSEPVSEARAVVVAALGQQLMVAGRNDDAIRWCQQAIELAGDVGARAVEGHARNSLGTALGNSGRVSEGLGQLHLAAALARETQSWTELARAAVNESGILESIGQLEAAAALATAAAADAVRHGLERSNGNFLRLNAIECLLELGRYDEAEAILVRIDRTRPVGMDDLRRLESWAALHMGRGDLDAAAATMAQLRGAVASRSEREFFLLRQREVELAVATGDHSRILGIVDDRPLRQFGGIVALLTAAATAAADRGDEAHRRSDRAGEQDAVRETRNCLDELLRIRDVEAESESTTAGFVSVVEGEYSRAEGKNDPNPWIAAAEVWRRQDRKHRLAYARFREADALLRSGAGASGARAPLTEARTVAEAIGARLLLEQIDALGRRGRVDIGAEGGASDGAVDRFRLTERELEVLNLVAKGRTNPQIAAALFISAKTASVHVSNILTKLGVANRGEAAAEARRLGLD